MPTEITKVLQQRGKSHGKFTDHARITQELKQVVFDNLPVSPSGVPHLQPDQQEALDMICHKIGRILAGDPNFHDHWLDISGYARLVADRLEGAER